MATETELKFKKSRTLNTVRKSERVPVGSYYDHTHYTIDCNTSERVLRAFIKWCETGNDTNFKNELDFLKEVYGNDYLKQMPFED